MSLSESTQNQFQKQDRATEESDLATVASDLENTRLKQRRRKVFRGYAVLLITFFSYLVVCTAFYTIYEGWHPSVSLSFIVETMTTVGKE